VVKTKLPVFNPALDEESLAQRLREQEELLQWSVLVKCYGAVANPVVQGQIFTPLHGEIPEGQSEGSWLDLAVARKILYLHGGTLVVKSEVGVGKTFTFAF